MSTIIQILDYLLTYLISAAASNVADAIRMIMSVFIADYTTIIVVLSVVGAMALIALAILFQFIRYA